MKTQDSAPSSLAEYVDLHTLQQVGEIPRVFPTVASLQWYIRMNRAALIENGALILIANRQRFHPHLFQQAVVEIGRITAAAR